MRIAVFYKKLQGAGGAERLCIEEHLHYLRCGADSCLVTYTANREALFEYVVPGLIVLGGGGGARSIWRLHDFLIRTRPDLVTVSFGHIDLYLAALGTGIPYLFYNHNPFFLYSDTLPEVIYSLLHRRVFREVRDAWRGNAEFSPERRRLRPSARLRLEAKSILNWLAVRRATAIVVKSKHTAWEVKKVYRRDAVISRSCVSPGLLAHRPRSNLRERLGLDAGKVILTVGRLTLEKRVGVLLEAFARVLKDEPSAFLVVAGTGPDLSGLQERARSLGIASSVHFAGFVPEDQLRDDYATADLFVTAAWADYIITPFEAMALGTPAVVSSEMEAEPELVACGMLITVDPEPEALARGILDGLRRPPGRRPEMAGFLWEKQFEIALKLARNAAASRRRP